MNLRILGALSVLSGGVPEVAPQPEPARVSATPGALRNEPGVPVPVQAPPVWGDVQGLPPEEPGTVLIVSMLVRERCGGRRDVVSPGTGPDDNPVRISGQVWGVRRLIGG